MNNKDIIIQLLNKYEADKESLDIQQLRILFDYVNDGNVIDDLTKLIGDDV